MDIGLVASRVVVCSSEEVSQMMEVMLMIVEWICDGCFLSESDTSFVTL